MELYDETPKQFKQRMHQRRIKEAQKESYRKRNNIADERRGEK